MDIRAISVASGIGGLDLGVKLACPGVRTVCYVEREAYAAATLVARMEQALLDSAPIWDDFTTLPGHWFSSGLDLAIAGIPCQPYSSAGRGLGEEDGRCLWSTMAEFLRLSGCPALFLENVRAFVSRGLPRVLGDLADLGFAAEWGTFSCAGLGASHRRERLFLLAYTSSFKQRFESWRRSSGSRTSQAEPEKPGARLANSQSFRAARRRGPTEGRLDRAEPGCVISILANSESFCRKDGTSAQERPGMPTSCCRLPFWPPGQDPSQWHDWPEHLWPSTERVLRGATDGIPRWLVESQTYRTDRLRALGNAVSPPVAAVAWHTLTERMLSR